MTVSHWLKQWFGSVRILVVYALAGALALTVELTLMHALVERAGWWYVWSSATSYVVGFFISFFLRKFFAFKDHNLHYLVKQIATYLAVLALCLLLNTSFVFALVESFSLPYLLAQVLSGSIVGMLGFTLNRRYTFKASYQLEPPAG